MLYEVLSILKSMNQITRDEFAKLLKDHTISRRLRNSLRYVPEEITHWSEREFLAVTDKAGNEGVLLWGAKVLPFVVAKRTANAKGRVEAIICDFCATWQRGTNSATITFKKDSKTTVSYLVCADLECSLHVRGLTKASSLSRTQLREQITSTQRIERLGQRLHKTLDIL